MNIGLLGGTFDPIHRGHIALARAAMEKCKLSRIYFVTPHVPPHKQRQPLSPFLHRYAMVTLATAPEKAFIPSLLEAPEEFSSGGPAAILSRGKGKDHAPRPNYTIETVRRLKQSFKAGDKLFLLMGIDAFADIANWHQAEDLLRECAFVVASRPGYSLADVANALPEKLRPRAEVTKPFYKQPAAGQLVLPGVTIHFLANLQQAANRS